MVSRKRRQREAQLYASNPPGVIRMFAPADAHVNEVNIRPRAGS